MENAPISCIIKENELIYSMSCTLFTDKNALKFESPIKMIKVTDLFHIIQFKRNFVIKKKYTDEIVLKSESFSSNIVDIEILDSNVYVLLFDGNLFTLSLTLDFIKKEKLFTKTIICGKIKNNKILIGSFDSYYIYSLVTQELINHGYTENRGRIFDINLSGDDILCCSDDRNIYLNNKQIISTDNNYFTKVESLDDLVFCTNRDGIFRIYKSNCLIFSQRFGSFNISALTVVSKDEILIGTVDGQIFEIKDFELKCLIGRPQSAITLKHASSISNIKALYESGAVLQDDLIFYDNRIVKISKRPIDFFADIACCYLLYSNFILKINHSSSQIHQINLGFDDDIYSKIELYKNIIYLSNHQSCFVFCAHCLSHIKKIKINKISTVRYGLLGTKNGWLTNGYKCQKISNYPIVDIFIDEQFINVLDITGRYFLIEKCDLCPINCNSCHNPETISDTNPVNVKDKHTQIEYSINKNSLFDISYFKNSDMNQLKARFSQIGLSEKNTEKKRVLEYESSLQFYDKNSCCKYDLEDYVDLTNLSDKDFNIYAIKLSNIDFFEFNNLNTEDKREFYPSIDSHIPNGAFILYNNNVEVIERKKNFTFIKELVYTLDHSILNIFYVSSHFISSIKFAKFTAFCKLKDGISLLGTDEGGIFLLINEKVVSQVALIGSIIEIFYLDSFAIIYTNVGFIYKTVIKGNRIFLIKEKQLSHKISAAYKSKVALSNGNVIEIDLDLKISNTYCAKAFISAVYLNFISYDGLVRDLTSKEKQKICERNIFCLKSYGDKYICTGDDQQIVVFNTKLNTISISSPHSSQIFDLDIFGDYIVSLSSDMTVCIMDNKLKVLGYKSHTVRSPSKIYKLDDQSFYILGESIEKIYLNTHY